MGSRAPPLVLLAAAAGAAAAAAAAWKHLRARREAAATAAEVRAAAVAALPAALPGAALHDVNALLVDHPQYRIDHVFHDTLNSADGVLCPLVAHDAATSTLAAVVHFGAATRGHPDLVHGGVTALTCDNLYGWCLFLSGRVDVLTAYLHLDYKAPLRTRTSVLVTVGIDKREGRKLYLTGLIRALDGSVTYATCTGLFVIPRDRSMFPSASQVRLLSDDGEAATGGGKDGGGANSSDGAPAVSGQS